MITRWQPRTTCDCEVEYTVNDSLPVDDAHGGLKVESFAFIEKCPAHTTFSDQQSWDIIWDENPRYAISRDLILSNAPASLYDVVDATTGVREFKGNVNVSWTWSGVAPNRILTITITGITLTNGQKNAIRNVLNNRFGVGRVVLA